MEMADPALMRIGLNIVVRLHDTSKHPRNRRDRALPHP